MTEKGRKRRSKRLIRKGRKEEEGGSGKKAVFLRSKL